MKKESFAKQLDEILNEYNAIKLKSGADDLSKISKEEMSKISTKISSAVERISGKNSEYYKSLKEVIESNYLDHRRIKYFIGIAQALKSDLENDYLKSLSDIIQSEVFSDYLEMAEHLLNEGYKDPAAVIIGSTLETHLRELCKSNDIDTEIIKSDGKNVTKKAEVMNADLVKKEVYSKMYQKQVTAWLDLRNNAAHGKYGEYKKEDVSLMLQGVRQFITVTK